MAEDRGVRTPEDYGYLPIGGATLGSTNFSDADQGDWNRSVGAAFENSARFDFAPLVSRYAKEYGLTEDEAREHIGEMIKFLCLAGASNTKYSMMGPVDHAWHMFILFTKMYTDFCNVVAGQYIHHNPGEILTGSRAEYLSGYEKLLSDYRTAFDVDPPPHIWPRIAANQSAVTSCISCKCDTCSPYHPPCD